MPKKDKGPDPYLQVAVYRVLRETVENPDAKFTEKKGALDTAINFEKMRNKLDDSDWGSGFANMDDEEA